MREKGKSFRDRMWQEKGMREKRARGKGETERKRKKERKKDRWTNIPQNGRRLEQTAPSFSSHPHLPTFLSTKFIFSFK